MTQNPCPPALAEALHPTPQVTATAAAALIPALAGASYSTSPSVRLMPVDQVLDIIGLKKSWLYKAIKEGNFPRPVSIPGTRRALFSSRDIDRWIAEKTAPAASLAAFEKGAGK